MVKEERDPDDLSLPEGRQRAERCLERDAAGPALDDPAKAGEHLVIAHLAKLVQLGSFYSPGVLEPFELLTCFLPPVGIATFRPFPRPDCHYLRVITLRQTLPVVA